MMMIIAITIVAFGGNNALVPLGTIALFAILSIASIRLISHLKRRAR